MRHVDWLLLILRAKRQHIVRDYAPPERLRICCNSLCCAHSYGGGKIIFHIFTFTHLVIYLGIGWLYHLFEYIVWIYSEQRDGTQFLPHIFKRVTAVVHALVLH